MTSPRDEEQRTEDRLAEETARLLDGRRFTPWNGVSAQSENVAIHVSPVVGGTGDTFSAAVACRAFGHRRVDWSRVSISVVDEAEEVVSREQLDSRGRALISGLPQRKLRIRGGITPSVTSIDRVRVSRETANSEELVQDSAVRQVFRPLGVPNEPWAAQALAAAGEKAPAAGDAWQPVRNGQLAGTDIGWTLWRTPEDDLYLSCETERQQWAGRAVRLEVLDPSDPGVGAPVFMTSLVFQEEGHGSWRTPPQLLPRHAEGGFALTVDVDGALQMDNPGDAGT